jgi:hypothetical protein
MGHTQNPECVKLGCIQSEVLGEGSALKFLQRLHAHWQTRSERVSQYPEGGRAACRCRFPYRDFRLWQVDMPVPVQYEENGRREL